MAQAVLETESGRAMLLNATMRQADIGRLLDNSEFLALLSEPWPHYVHYRARHGRGSPHHCAPDKFGFMGKYGPSDCDWIVPGTYR